MLSKASPVLHPKAFRRLALLDPSFKPILIVDRLPELTNNAYL